MQTLTDRLLESGLTQKMLSERQIERAVGGAAGRRYGLVNRALRAGELVRVRRGLYILPPRFRTEPPHPFAIAQALEPGSYVSFETALSAHGWTPEAVRVTASVVPGRKSSKLEHPSLGSYEFRPLAINKECFLELIERRQLGSQIALLAHPLRALVDLITFRKLNWHGLAALTNGMRIDEERLHRITRTHIQTLTGVYKQTRPRNFLSALARELGLD